MCLPTGGGVLIAEKLLNEDKSGPPSAQLQSLNMLVCTEGRERTLSEYRKLLEDAARAREHVLRLEAREPQAEVEGVGHKRSVRL